MVATVVCRRQTGLCVTVVQSWGKLALKTISRLSVVGVLVVSAVAFSPKFATAQSGVTPGQVDDDEQSSLEWKPEWSRFQVWQGAATAGMAVGIGALMFLPGEGGD